MNRSAAMSQARLFLSCLKIEYWRWPYPARPCTNQATGTAGPTTALFCRDE